MNAQTKEKFVEKGRILTSQHIAHLSDEYRKMSFEQSRRGMLGSGSTIDVTTKLISVESKSLYSNILEYVAEAPLQPSENLEGQIAKISEEIHEKFCQEALPFFQKSVEQTRKPELFDRMLPDLESKLAKNRADFQNRLNLLVQKINDQSGRDKAIIILWGVEFTLLALTIFIAGMWYQKPDENYEPLLVLLASLAAITGLIIKWRRDGT